jgi:hypothetical protein
VSVDKSPYALSRAANLSRSVAEVPLPGGLDGSADGAASVRADLPVCSGGGLDMPSGPWDVGRDEAEVEGGGWAGDGVL